MNYIDKVEPEAARALSRVTSDGDFALISIAISLKRIADTLDGTAAGVNITQTIFAGRKE